VVGNNISQKLLEVWKHLKIATRLHLLRVISYLRFQVLAMASMKMTVLWDIVPCTVQVSEGKTCDVMLPCKSCCSTGRPENIVLVRI
jgi:hypothetical protein